MTFNDKTQTRTGACQCSEICLSCKCNHSYPTTKQPEDYGQRVSEALQRFTDRQRQALSLEKKESGSEGKFQTQRYGK
jgi:hypothetical protein